MHDIRSRIEALSPEQRGLLADRLLQPEDGSEAAASTTQLVAYVVPTDPWDAAPDSGELRRFLRERLPEHMVPSVFVLLDALPRLPNGKVDLRALPEPAPVTDALSQSYVPPRNPVEHALAEIWAGVLGTDRIGVHDSFFEIGGDSILSIQVVARANQAGLSLTPDQLFEFKTLAGLAAVVGTAPVVAAEQGPVTGPVPLTPIQHWFFEQPLPEPHHWHQTLWFEIPSGVGMPVLKNALQQVILQHDALRLRFAHETSGWRQFHAPVDTDTPITYVDLAALPEAEQEQALRQAAVELAAGCDLAEEPLIRVTRFALGEGRPDRLLIAIHHLVVDPMSWGILLEDLEAAVAQLSRGEDVVLPPKTTSFRAWAEALADHAASETLRAEREFWLALPQAVHPLPVDSPGVFTEASAETVTTFLSVEETRSLLFDAPAAYNTNPEEILLTAVVQAFGGWLPEARPLVGLERHGRESVAEGINLSRTVGWFTSFFPVLLELEGVQEPGAAIKTIKEQLRRVPGRGIGYGVLRYLSGDGEVRDRLRGLAQPQVIFNYSRQAETPRAADALLRPLGLPTSSRSPRNQRGHLLEINAYIAGDRLDMHWTYSGDIHRRATIERVAGDHLTALRALIAHSVSPEAGGYTPSDFPEAGLSQEELDRFMDTLFS